VSLDEHRGDAYKREAAATRRAVEEVCQSCFGTGTKLEEGKGAVLCDCQRTNTEENFLQAAKIPARFQDRNFRNYYPKNDSQTFALNFSETFVSLYPGIDRGLLLIGGVGVGKTHLAIAILKELIIQKGVKGLFYESGSLLKALQASYNPISQTSEMEVLAPVLDVEILVLDELGAMVMTDWVRDTLYQIINTRYNRNRITIFTTNYVDELGIEEEVKELKARLAALSRGESNSEKIREEKALELRIRKLASTQ